MKFTEAIDKDLEIFMNLEEFAEKHEINGEEMRCIFDQGTREMNGGDSKNFEGLHGDFATLYVKSGEITRIPKQGENFKIDGQRYTVERVDNLKGIIEISVSAYRQGLR